MQLLALIPRNASLVEQLSNAQAAAIEATARHPRVLIATLSLSLSFFLGVSVVDPLLLLLPSACRSAVCATCSGWRREWSTCAGGGGFGNGGALLPTEGKRKRAPGFIVGRWIVDIHSCWRIFLSLAFAPNRSVPNVMGKPFSHNDSSGFLVCRRADIGMCFDRFDCLMHFCAPLSLFLQTGWILFLWSSGFVKPHSRARSEIDARRARPLVCGALKENKRSG